MFKMMTYQLQM